MLDIFCGLFLCPDIPAIRGCHRFFDALLGDDYLGCSNGDSRFFINCYIQDSMQTSILFKAPGRSSNRPIVILTGLDIEASSTKSLRYAKNCSTNHFHKATKMLSRALSKAWNWTRCNCTPVRIIRAIFSEKVSTVVAVLVLAAMYWHILSIDNTIESQEAVAFDCLLGMPWGIVWAIRATRMPMPEEGGEE